MNFRKLNKIKDFAVYPIPTFSHEPLYYKIDSYTIRLINVAKKILKNIHDVFQFSQFSLNHQNQAYNY